MLHSDFLWFKTKTAMRHRRSNIVYAKYSLWWRENTNVSVASSMSGDERDTSAFTKYFIHSTWPPVVMLRVWSLWSKMCDQISGLISTSKGIVVSRLGRRNLGGKRGIRVPLCGSCAVWLSCHDRLLSLLQQVAFGQRDLFYYYLMFQWHKSRCFRHFSRC